MSVICMKSIRVSLAFDCGATLMQPKRNQQAQQNLRPRMKVKLMIFTNSCKRSMKDSILLNSCAVGLIWCDDSLEEPPDKPFFRGRKRPTTTRMETTNRPSGKAPESKHAAHASAISPGRKVNIQSELISQLDKWHKCALNELQEFLAIYCALHECVCQ